MELYSHRIALFYSIPDEHLIACVVDTNKAFIRKYLREFSKKSKQPQ
jgi:hypothetical protein